MALVFGDEQVTLGIQGEPVGVIEKGTRGRGAIGAAAGLPRSRNEFGRGACTHPHDAAGLPVGENEAAVSILREVEPDTTR
ncbi:hypothetical protein D3C86_1802610 [compost metagenome]